MNTPILEISDLRRVFGGLMALMDVSFTVSPGRIKSIIGPNGAGKTTLFNIITGVLPPTSGFVRFKGRTLTGQKPHVIADWGVCRTFQTVELFGNMTALENVMVGRHLRSRMGLLRSGLRWPGVMREEREIVDASHEALKRVGLTHRAALSASSLPLGEQKLLEVARALATDPELILLDEPAGGLNETEVARMAEIIREIRSQGITVLLVEHHMDLVMGISDEIVVLRYGKVISEGDPSTVRSDQHVIDAYLGEDIDYA